MLGIVLALACGFFVALSQLFLRKSYKELQPSIAFFFDAVFGLLIWMPLAILMGISGTVSWSQAFFFATVSAILSEAIVFFALSKGELAVTATILATYPVYTIIFSRVFNHEILSNSILLFICLTVVGSIIASFPDKLKKQELQKHNAIIWPFVAAVCIGLSDTISKGYINRSNDFSLLLSLGFVQIPVALVYLKIEKESFQASVTGVLRRFKDYKFALLGGLFNIIGTGFLWLSFSFAPASIASPITGTNGVLTVLLSRFLLKEKISAHKYVGIVLAFIGLLGISILRAQSN